MADDLKSEESRSPAKDCGFSCYRLAVLPYVDEFRTAVMEMQLAA